MEQSLYRTKSTISSSPPLSSSSSSSSSPLSPLERAKSSKPIRPRPILASAFSFDSGYEISPLHNQSFRFGGEEIALTSSLTDHPSTTINHNRSQIINTLIDDGNHRDRITDDDDDDDEDDLEGYDDELITINDQFTPIHSPSLENCSYSLPGVSSQSRSLQTNQQPRSAFNLALIRQQNRLRQAQICSMMFDREQTSFLETNNLNDIDSFDVQPNGHDLKASLSSTSSSLSRCSSTPIPIPGANSLRRNHLSSAFSKVTKFDDDDDDVDDDVEGNQCQSSADCIDGQSLSTIEYSLPDGRRMPYYHRMAPKLANFTTENESKEKEESEKDANPIQLSRGSRSQHRFGSRFEISFDMIYNNRSCYSPPLWNGGIGSSSTGFLARFGVLSPQQLLDPKQSFINPRLKEAFSDLYCLSPYDSCRLLTPHPEIDETLLDSDGVVDAQQNPIATIIKDEDRNYESDATSKFSNEKKI
ncbi:hypothetical protein QR98_0071680 [Sarcoptes scabiei]|uniref:Uncharacterized protein n=1 Tax=Sarcoptes scabiei TaxID=52283 RepID=A0A132ACC7_SARSC|nr:hypothetical protein QR98_0071680 [Sarcoptes scabiei]